MDHSQPCILSPLFFFFSCSQSAAAPVETIQLGEVSGSPLKSVAGPYDASSLHTFIRDTFPGAILLEEHQVSELTQKPTV